MAGRDDRNMSTKPPAPPLRAAAAAGPAHGKQLPSALPDQLQGGSSSLYSTLQWCCKFEPLRNEPH